MHVVIVGSSTRDLEDLLRPLTTHTSTAYRLESVAAANPDVVVLDIRQEAEVPSALASFRKEHPAIGVVIVAARQEPALLIAAMRAGVSEFVAEPLQQDDLLAAVQRVAGVATEQTGGQVFAVIGAKGGVGVTTLAVNLATSLSGVAKGGTLLIDLHLDGGEAALFLSATPSYSVIDAIENGHKLDEAFLKGLVVKTAAGPDLLASGDHPDPARIDGRQIRAVVEAAAKCYRFVVLDMPRHDAAVRETLGLASSITIVTTQELGAIRNAAKMAASLRQRHGADRVQVVLNRYDRAADIPSEDIERAVGGSIGHMFPSNYRQAIDALHKGRPLVVDNHNKLAGALAAYAKSLSGPAKTSPRAERPAGLLVRLTGRR
jgi:pilus assembly protein CpaE